jgi:hypothetical protein
VILFPKRYHTVIPDKVLTLDLDKVISFPMRYSAVVPDEVLIVVLVTAISFLVRDSRSRRSVFELHEIEESRLAY